MAEEISKQSKMKSRNRYELELMRKSGVIASKALKKAIESIKVGISELEVDKMVEEDIAIDEVEEQIFGEREEGLTGIDERDLRRIVRDYNKSENKEKVKKSIKKAKGDLEKYFLKKVSISDPESRMMQNKKGFSELSYNTQISVSRNQIIIANDICQDGHDVHQFIPQVNNVKENVKLSKNTKIGLDCGYSDSENIKFAEDENIDLYVPSRAQAQEFDGKKQSLNHDKYEYDWKKDELIVGKNRFYFKGVYTRKNGKKIIMYYNDKLKRKKDVPFHFRERLRMRDKMSAEDGRKVYGLRKITVEPVYGNIKQNFGFREFLLRGLEKVKIELNLVCIAHNLQKIWKFGAARSC